MKVKIPEIRNLLLLCIPAACIWWEIILMLLRGDGVYSLFYPVIFAACAGVAAAGIFSFFRSRTKIMLLNIVLFIVSIFFSIEYLIRNIYTTYLTPRYLISGAQNAAAGYSGEIMRSVLFGLPKAMLFMIPFFLSAFHGILENKRRKKRISSIKRTERRHVWRNIAAVSAGIVFCAVFSLMASHGRYSAVYGAQFDYNQATNLFGLMTSTRLSVQYAVFGNDHAVFSIVPAAAQTAESETADPENSEQTGAETELILPESGSNSFGKVPGMNGFDLETQKAENKEETVDENNSSDTQPETENDTSENTEQETANTAKADEQQDGEQDPQEDTEQESQQKPEDESAKEQESGQEEPIVYAPHQMELDFSKAENTGEPAVDQLTAYIKTLTPAAENEYTGIFKGKNLILICAESYCDAFISEELTPTLWRLSRNGFYFHEYYQPEWGGSTTTGEAAFLLGLAPQDGDRTMLQSIGNNLYFTMGNQLQRLGYSSIAFHGGEDTFYNRDKTHENLGYNQFVANRSGIREICGNIYPRDTIAFSKTMDLFLDHQPFSVYYMTISGHAPYKKDYAYTQDYYSRVSEAVGDTYAEKTKYYICYQMELEEAMKIMVEKLEEAGIADDTVIAMVGDHYPYGLGRGEAWGNDRDYINDLIKGDDTIPYEQDRSGLIIWSGCLEKEYADLPKDIEEPVFCLDVLPTLSNLFGLTYDARLLAGRDVFSDEEPLVFWNNLSWVTAYGRYDARHGVFTPGENFPENEDEAAYRARIDETVRNRILMSRSIMGTDYYGILLGPDDVKQAGDILWQGQ